MDVLEMLLAEHPGDEAWWILANAYQAHRRSPAYDSMLREVGVDDLTVVMAGVLGDDAHRWLRAANPALGGISPRDALVDAVHGVKVVKSLLMRLPV